MTHSDSPRAIVRRLLLALLLVLPLGMTRPATAFDLTDLWWNSAESGWGVNFIQADDFVFATFFLYGLNKEATWYTGQMTIGSNGVWSGPLYATNGSYFGGPWNPADRLTTQVGTVTFTPTNSYSGILSYDVNGTTVNKTLSRQTLKTIPLGGSYSGSLLSILSGCDDPANNQPLTLFYVLEVGQSTGGQLQLDFEFSGGTCGVGGTFIQNGQLYRVPGATYACTPGGAYVAQLTQVKATNQGIEGQWTSPVGAGCLETAYFSAVLQ